MNKVILTGRLTKDAELKFTQGKGTAKSDFNIAVDDGFGENKKTYFIPVVLWGKSAEGLSPYLVKGTKVLVNGKMVLRSYEDKDGNKKYITEVVADLVNGIELLGSKGDKKQDAGYGTLPPMEDDITPVDDGDMPF